MKRLNSILLFLLMININAQIRFEQGYIIDNNDQKQNVLIKNIDWLNNPKSIEYRLEENSKIEIGNINQIKEFGINNETKYIRKELDIDMSSSNSGNLSTKKDPEFVKQTVFLKVLIEGKPSLYKYTDGSLYRYFFLNINGELEQLIYKKYEVDTNVYSYNKNYQSQIFRNFKCSSEVDKQIKNTDYTQNALVRLFLKLNECNQSSISYEDKKSINKLEFNLSIRPRINFNKLTINNLYNIKENYSFDDKINVSLGVEAEMLLPFNKNKWSIIIEPNYNYYKGKKEGNLSANSMNNIIELDYKAIDIPFGIRYSFYTNLKSRVFINALYNPSLNLNSKINFTWNDVNYRNLDIKSRGNFALGLGYNYNNKWNIEFRYMTEKEILSDYMYWDNKFSTISFVLGYNIF